LLVNTMLRPMWGPLESAVQRWQQALDDCYSAILTELSQDRYWPHRDPTLIGASRPEAVARVLRKAVARPTPAVRRDRCVAPPDAANPNRGAANQASLNANSGSAVVDD